ncbi:hypothetical protein C1645_732910 [Glomus cerebriforme]|uniref:Uncharacterized protein n=1 Tax=Glomus cerebriforme TaxID=658196 RepID=A0A397TQ01_9GLOM|nr:hypothetical protein C1645_732910 [Glomus cerebriforme]
MSQDYYGQNSRYPSSWNVINNDLHDDDDNRYYPSYATETWSVLDSQDVNEDQLPSFPQHNYIGGYNYGSSTIRQPSPPLPEPEFPPSISSSTKGFIETTFKYERKREEDIVGRPDEYDDDCCPPPPQLPLDDSDIQSSIFDEDSKSIVRKFISTISSSSGLVRYSLAVLAIGIAIYYIKDIKDFPFVEFYNIF